jgi:capsular exopolysaccharide synthesis family protein
MAAVNHGSAAYLPYHAQATGALIPRQTEYISFREAVAFCWAEKRVLTAFVLAGVLLSLLLVLIQKRVYQSKTSIEIQMPNDDYLNRRHLNPVVEPGVILLEPFMQTQMKLIQTDTMLLRTVDNLGARRHPDLFPAPGKLTILSSTVFGRNKRSDIPPSNAAILEQIRKRLNVRAAGQTQIVEISMESSDPKFATDFLNALTKEYRAESRERIVALASQTADLLSAQIEELKKAVEEAENELRAFVTANTLLIGGDKESFAETELRQTQAALGKAHDARLGEESRYETVRNASPEALAKALDSDTLRAYRVRLTELRQKRAEAIEVYKPAHYAVRQIEAEIKEVEMAFEREHSSILARLREQYQAAQLRENALQQDYERQAGMVANQMGKSIRFTALKRNLDTRRQLYESMLEKMKEAGLVTAMQASNVRVLDPATLPERPIKPNKLLYAAIGLASGVLNGLFYLLVIKRNSAVQRPRAAVEEPSQITHLANVPKLDAEAGRWPEVLPSNPESELALTESNMLRATNISFELTAFRRKDSEGARAFQSIVKRLFFSAPRGSRVRLLTVTSACHGEGRTTVVCNIGAALARTGLMVLIIDGDRINPRLHHIFGIPNETGFTDLIAQHVDGTRSMASESSWVTEVPGLFVLPGGQSMGRLASLLDDPRALGVLDGCCRDFDVVIVDAPPILSPGDARSLCMHADQVLMVNRQGCASEQLIAAAERQLNEYGCRVAGKVINCYEPEPQESTRELEKS